MKVILYCNIFTQSYSFKETHQWYWKTVSGVPQMVVPVTKVGANVNQFNLTDVQVYTS